MVNTRIAVCSVMVFALMLMLGSVQCTSGQSEAPSEPVRAGVNSEGFQPEPEALHVTVKIVLHKTGSDSWAIKEVAPKGPDICRTMGLPVCDGTQFLWTVVGYPMVAGESVIIKQAPPAPDCFQWDQWVIEGPNSAVTSGLPTCDGGKYGVFWPYDVEFWKDGVKKAETDPRGIVH